MAKNDNAHGIRLHKSLRETCGETIAEQITSRMPLSKSADIDKKFAWAQKVCETLEQEFEENDTKRIRMGCACTPETGKIGKLRALYLSCGSMEEFVDSANKLETGFTIEQDGEVLYMVYPVCYCSCVKRVDQPISRTWCYCTLGYAEIMFEQILGREVRVELMESIKTGGKECRIKIMQFF